MTSPLTIPEFQQGSRTDPGRDPGKLVNEDATAVETTPLGVFAAVCDGMGGHSSGRLASTTALSCILKSLQQTSLGEVPSSRLELAIVGASAEVYRLAPEDADADRPGSTCVCLLLHDGAVDIAHVGDSRAYVLREGQLRRLTRDHSVVEALIEAGLVSPKDALDHPDAHRITRALGIDARVEVELRADYPVQPRDRYLLCSDGLTDLVDDQELLSELSTTHVAQEACERLVDLANQRGGHDNISVVILDIGVPGPYVARSTPANARVSEFETPMPQSATPDTGDRTTLPTGAPAPVLQTVEIPAFGSSANRILQASRDQHGLQPQAKRWIFWGIVILLACVTLTLALARHQSAHRNHSKGFRPGPASVTS